MLSWFFIIYSSRTKHCGSITLVVCTPIIYPLTLPIQWQRLTEIVLLSISTFLAITITCPARSSIQLDSSYVWTQFANGSGGWPDGISFLTGLSTPQFMLSGLDATLHLAEECLQPERIVPKAVIVTVIVGFLTAFPFSIAIIYSYKDIELSLTTPTGYVGPNSSRSTRM